MDTDEFLEHVGVKGMRWGVRNKRDRSRTTFRKSPDRLPDSELRGRINRMETEQRYNALNRRDKSMLEQAASEVLIQSGKAIATRILINGGSYGVKMLIKKKFGEDVAKGFFPKK